MDRIYQDRESSSNTPFESEELPSRPRRQRRRVMPDPMPAPASEPTQSAPSVSVASDAFKANTQEAPRQPPHTAAAAASRPAPQPAAKKKAPAAPKVKGPGFFARMKADKRPAIFTGIVCLVAAIYMIVSFISFFATAGAADQSILHTGGLNGAIAATENVVNTAGPLGAWLSESLISNGLGLGALIIPYYLCMLGLSLVGLIHCKFWSMTAKSLLSMIALSIVVGMITYNMTTTFYWGGRHGHDINMLLKQTTGIWGMIGVSVILVASVAMIFLKQISDVGASISRVIKRRRDALAAKRQAAEEAAQQEQTENVEPQPQPAAPDSEFTPEIQTAEPNEVEPEPEPEPLSFDPAAKPDQPDPLEVLDEPATPTDLDSLTPLTLDSDNIVVTTAPVIEAAVPAQVESAPATPVVYEPEIPAEPDIEQPVDTIVDAAPIEQASDNSATQNFYDPTAELSLFRKPSLDLLDDHPVSASERNEQEQTENINNIRRVLSNFGIEIARIEAVVGPTVTLYEIVPAEGIRINKIRSLEDDIALSLSALGIRIIAPMPGKGTIGIEVPNKKPQIVSIRSILASKKYQESTAELPMAMGATISNDVYIADLTKMPHLLVAGSTGMGKSVGLNTIIASILYKKHPAEVKFVLIDPKMVEFSLYNKIERHYLAKLPGEDEAIITNTDKVVPTLLSLCIEMDNRYELLKKANVRSIKEYNGKFINMKLNPTQGHRYLPYIVVVIDEFADLIMTAGKEVETPIARIAQKARAVGIHVILATQRPSANIITGVIRANFPGRIAFRVTQQLESRIILDRQGANQLIGRGDMLFSRDGIVERVQCAFIDTHEVEAICDAIGRQAGYPMAYELPEYVPPTADGGDGGQNGVSIDRDPLFEAAAREVIDQNVGSASLLQRRFEIGYPRAGKLMDQLERAGVVGPAQGGKPRKVLMTHMDFDQWLAGTGTTQYTPLNGD